MIIDVLQQRKGYYSAEFAIVYGDSQVGQISMEGKFGFRDLDVNGVCFNDRFELFKGKTDDVTEEKPYRPYVITGNGYVRGTVYQTSFSAGFFKSYDYTQMTRDGIIYNMYPIDLKQKGVSPIYIGDKQIAQIEKDAITYNDLHNFRIFAPNSDHVVIAVLYAAYMYVCSCYKPGEKVKKSISKEYSVTRNKLLLEKYNPNFAKDMA